jgi:PHD/YefM family antitoxin component YafN of YafNO toxin-antitoxin module
MGIFDFLKPQEEQYYLKFKKMITHEDRNRVTVLVLSTRLMTIQIVIENQTRNYNELQEEKQKVILNDTKLYKKYSDKSDDLKLKLTVLFRIQMELQKDFIRGATIKLKEVGHSDIPVNYPECKLFYDKISTDLWNKGERKISLEKLENFKV